MLEGVDCIGGSGTQSQIIRSMKYEMRTNKNESSQTLNTTINQQLKLLLASTKILLHHRIAQHYPFYFHPKHCSTPCEQYYFKARQREGRSMRQLWFANARSEARSLFHRDSIRTNYK